MRVFTIGHGTRDATDLTETLVAAGVETLVDVRRFPGSRRHPQFNRAAIEATATAAGIHYLHLEELGGRRTDERGEEKFCCIRVAAFRSYAARMGTPGWQTALDRALAEPTPCFMCAETLWWRCHRRLISDLLAARGHEVLHLLRPDRSEPHRPLGGAEYREGRLYLCGHEVA